MIKRLSSAPLLALAAVGVAACGSSSSPGTKIVLAPSAGATIATTSSALKAATSTTPTTPTATTPAPTPVPTPTSGPLSKQPAIKIPKGHAPKSLVIKDLIKGKGPVAGTNSSIVVNYVGALYKGGKIFDASWKRNQTLPAQLGPSGTVIPGWLKGVPGMHVGGRRELIIPPGLGYGPAGSGPIPPNSTLVFVIDLLKVG
ncbi:MAG: FKBP-type peptidyl-prolyl cis-trans isomerase [Solirubrobacteraceae bacterium]